MILLFMYNTALTFHIIGISIMVGTTICQFIIFRAFYKDKIANSPDLIRRYFGLDRYVIAGLMIIILSGSTMLYLVNGAYGDQVWFKVKMLILISMGINVGVFNKRFQDKLLGLLEGNKGQQEQKEIKKVKSKIHYRKMLELAMFAVIFVLAVFKFN